MNTKPKIKQIQLLGSTFVSGYFAFAELVNYKQFNQRKIVKPFEMGAGVQYGSFTTQCLNVVEKNDSVGNININYGMSGQKVPIGFFSPSRPSVIPIPFDFSGLIFIIKGYVRVYDSSNKSFSKYIFVDANSSIWIGAELTSYTLVNDFSVDKYIVAYIDMCINTTEPITLNYVGEAEFIQNSNIDNNFTPLFKINRYDYNCY